jgi:hypothetical protein
MKKYIIGVLFGLSVLAAGCLKDDDGYSLDQMWVAFGMLEETSSDPLEYKIILDDGNILIPVASGYYRPWYYYGTDDPESRLKTGDRILINYTIIGDDADENGEVTEYYIRVNSVQKILKKGIIDITAENQDSIGNDPVIVRDCWLTDSLLNFEIKYWGRYEIHYINLVKEPGTLTELDQPVELELRHNDNGDIEDIPYAAYVSFNLEKLQIEGLDSVAFRVTCKDYNGDLFEYENVYNYSENN